MEQREQTIREVVGENVRRIREAAGARQDDVAAAAKGVGLNWSRSKVAALERGDKAVDLAEAVLLAEALCELTDQPVSVTDLVAGEGPVRLSARTVLHREALRRFLGGAPVEVKVSDIPGGTELMRTLLTEMPATVRHLSQLAGPDADLEALEHAEDVAGEAEERVGRVLGLTKAEVTWLSVGLWDRTLGEERDARVGDDLPAASRSAKRGRVTRELVKELRARLEEVSNVER